MKLLPKIESGKFEFITTKAVNVPKNAVAMIKETKGTTLVVPTNKTGGEIFALISLMNETKLTQTGITAKFSKALSDAEIPCNVFAGFYHDHILVPYHLREKAIEIISLIEI